MGKMSVLQSLMKPTVADLISYLQAFPPETPIRIEDADTNHTIEIFHFSEGSSGLTISGEYSEMV